MPHHRLQSTGHPGLRPVRGLNLINGRYMARKPNYGFEKRRKELERKQKQDAKVARRAEEAKQRAETEAPRPDEVVEERDGS